MKHYFLCCAFICISALYAGKNPILPTIIISGPRNTSNSMQIEPTVATTHSNTIVHVPVATPAWIQWQLQQARERQQNLNV